MGIFYYWDICVIEELLEKITLKNSLFCKNEVNGKEYFTNHSIKFKKVREELIEKLNKLDANTKNKTLLEMIKYYYYSKKLSKSKEEERIKYRNKLIKEFIKNMYYTHGKERNKQDN